MGDNQGGLVNRTSRFYNNQEFSDVEFTIKDGLSCTTIYAHKQILSMASTVFASLFTTKTQQKVQIKVSEFCPRIVDLVLSYLYTDELPLTSIDEAVDVLKLSEKFGIDELKVLCRKYISLDNLSIENVLTVYEIALKENVTVSLKKCQELVSRQTAAVLALPRFREASKEVIIDILSLNYLSVSENELLMAVMTWVKRDCQKRGRPTENICLRDSLSPLLPYIRILTLSIEEFYDFVEEHDIFTNPESIKLTRKILEPDAACTVPPGFSSVTTPRLKPGIANGVSAHKMHENSLVSKNNYKEVPFSKFPQAPPHKSPATLSVNKASLPVSVNNLSLENSTSPITSFQNGVWDDNLNAPEKPLFQFAAATSSIPPPQRRPLMMKVMNNHVPNNLKKTYDFPLQEIHPQNRGLNALSEKDLICSAELKCTKGSIVILGVELKVANQKNEESIKVHTLISGGVPERDIEKYYKHTNNMIQISFDEPLKLNSTMTSAVNIEITIEDMRLDRCSICRVSVCEINSGLNLTTLVKLRSNQPNQVDGFFFFISRLIYG